MDIKQTYPYYADQKVIYVHGFASSGATHTAQLLAQKMPQAQIIHPDLPISPAEMLPFLEQLCQKEQPALIIGTSMGGALVEKLRGYDRICVNPALHMDQSFGHHIKYGDTPFTSPRQDGITSFNATKTMAKEFAEVSQQNFEQLTPEDAQRVTGLFGKHDEFLDNYDEFHHHYPHSAYYDGGHRLNDKAFTIALLPIICRYWQRRQGIEPPVIYADIDLFRRPDNLQQPSSRIALQTLQQNYHLFVVLPTAAAVKTPTHQSPTAAEWLEDNMGIAAFERIIYCDHPQLLLGDYYITQNPSIEEQFLGTTLTYGSPQFKTWESLITFFEHLNGQ